MSSRSVLIADGSPRLARLLAQLLAAEEGFTVAGVCGDREGALERARAGHPDVVLVGEALDDGSGAELCQALREAAPDARLLLWSDATDPGPADCVLDRGLSFRELITAIGEECPPSGRVPGSRGRLRRRDRVELDLGAPRPVPTRV